MFSKKDTGNIILHVILISTLIIIFFFTYVTTLEEEIVKDQVDFIIEDLTEGTKLFPREVTGLLRTSIDEIELPDMKEIDEEVEKKNKRLRNHVLVLSAAIVVSGLSLVYFMSQKYNFSFLDVVKHNAIVLAFVGLTGFFFLRYLAKNFRSGDPNHVKKTVLVTLKNMK
jgi:hypothetical protein